MTPRSLHPHVWIPALAATLALVCSQSAVATSPAVALQPVLGNGLIAFTTNRDGNSEIYTMSFDGAFQTDISNRSSFDAQPAWSPDGTKIAFTSDRDGNLEIYVMSAKGSNQTRLTTNAGSDSQPAWSPDGTKIAFTTNRDGNNEVYVMNAEGSGSPVDFSTDPSASDTVPVWAPDHGRRIAYQSDRTGNYDVFSRSLSNGSPNQMLVYADLTHAGASDTEPSWQPLPPYSPSGPIKHVVIIYEENHSFDNIFGVYCTNTGVCDGAESGYLPNGTQIPLSRAKDLVVQAGHDYVDQIAVINGGAMNGWPNETYDKCGADTGYQCYTQYHVGQIPTIISLAQNFAISDRFFELDPVGSWGSHLELVTSHLDGFYTGNHHAYVKPPVKTRGWGCDTGQGGDWWSAARDRHPVTAFDCVPGPDGAGPLGPTPVPWVPTLFNRMDQAGLPYKLYAPAQGGGYGWSICPTFGECLDGPQHDHWVDPYSFATDATAGNLPALSILTPYIQDSAHNGRFMSRGDNWIATNVNAIMNGPDWASTAVFVTFDDCGCFYDHVPPPPNLGLRLPIMIVSPYAKTRFVDHTISSQASIQAFTEHALGLAPLSPEDALAYDFSNVFDYGQAPSQPMRLALIPIPEWKIRYDETHPMSPNTPDD
jgi:phospholipase C